MDRTINDVSQEELDTAWDAIISETRLGVLEAGEMTAEMFAAKSGFSRVQATRILRDMFEAGVLTRRAVLVNGRRALAYKPKVR